jgi:hypothetical protein
MLMLKSDSTKVYYSYKLGTHVRRASLMLADLVINASNGGGDGGGATAVEKVVVKAALRRR